MAFPVAAAIAAGANLAGSALNAGLTSKVNRQSQRFAREMFNLQNQRDIDFWNMQNDYNSPSAQMGRFKEAGLNPNMIYGQMSQAAPVHTSQAPSWSPKAPEVDLPSAVSSFFDVQARTAQTDNLRAQNTVLLEEAALKKAQTLNTLSTITNRDFDLDVKSQLRDINVDYRSEQLRGLKTRTDVALQENERRELLTAQSLKEGVHRILQMRANTAKVENERAVLVQQMRKLATDVDMQQLMLSMERDMRSQGLTSKDPAWQRLIAILLGKLGVSLR